MAVIIGTLLAIAVGTGAFASNASAGTVKMVGSQIRIDAAPGEANRMRIWHSCKVHDFGNGPECNTDYPPSYVIADTVSLTVYSPCEVGPTYETGELVASCPISATSVAVTLNDRDDTFEESVSTYTQVEMPIPATVDGGTGMDVMDLVSQANGNTLLGGAGNYPDILDGSAKSDTLRGGDGVDVINGKDGGDYIYGEAGTDTLDGGGHVDHIWGGENNDTIHGGDAADYLYGEGGVDTIYGDPSNTSPSGGGDTIAGGSHGDVIHGRNGNDTIHGDAGEDTIYGEDGDDKIWGGDHTDTIHGNAGDDDLHGDSGVDDLFGESDDDTMDGGPGADAFDGGSHVNGDTVTYESRSANLDVTIGSGANDGESGEGDDVKTSVEIVKGGSGNDKLTGDGGTDELHGRGGNDTLNGGSERERDYLWGNGGTNTVSYAGHSESVFASLETGDNTDLDVWGNIQNLTGSSYWDILRGDEGVNRLKGGAGSAPDSLDGGLGPDKLDGEGGSDTVRYTERSTRVVADLDGGVGGEDADGNGVPEEDDELISLENAFTGSGDDTLIGSNENNRLDGGGGDDSMIGNLGADDFSGGDAYGPGIDTVDYSDISAPGVVVGIDDKANDGLANGGEGDNVHSDVENLIGSQGGDVIIGSDAIVNTIHGQGGGDLIAGGNETGPGDKLYGDAGPGLTLKGQAGNDWLFGQNGNDTLDGGRGTGDHDLFEGGEGHDVADYSARTQWVNVSIGVDTREWNDGALGENDSVEPSIEEIRGGSGPDVLKGGRGTSSTLRGGDGDDFLIDGGNDDLIHPADCCPDISADVFDGGDHDSLGDTVSYGIGGELLSQRYGDLVIKIGGGAVSGLGCADGDAGPCEGDNVTTSVENVWGGAGDDKIYGNGANNQLFGFDGDDLLRGNGGSDLLQGGEGTDTADYSGYPESLPVVVTIGDGKNNDGAAEGDNVTYDVENVDGGEGGDLIFGTEEENHLFGNGGADYLLGGDGDDIYDGGSGDDWLLETFWSETDGLDRMMGGPDNDTMFSGKQDDWVFGEGGNDLIDAGYGRDLISGGNNNDMLAFGLYGGATQGVDAVLGSGEGEDLLINDIENVAGGPGSDYIVGNELGNMLVGCGGNDIIDGGLGNDLVLDALPGYVCNGGGANYLSGGPGPTGSTSDSDAVAGYIGEDTVYYRDHTAPVTVEIGGGPVSGVSGENDNILGGVYGVEDVVGSLSAKNELIGDHKVNALVGGDKNDTIRGRGDGDFLYGETYIGGENESAEGGADWIFGLDEGGPEWPDYIDCGGPSPPYSAYDDGPQPELEDWVDIDPIDGPTTYNCENFAEPKPEEQSADFWENPEEETGSDPTNPSPDTTAPRTKVRKRPHLKQLIQTPDERALADPTPTFYLLSNEGDSTFECWVDSGTPTSCESPYTPAAVSKGKHKLHARATDKAGNTDPSSAVSEFEYKTDYTRPNPGPTDRTPPETTITKKPPLFTSDPTFEFTSNEPGSTFKCQIDTQPWASCTSPHTVTSILAGGHTFYVRAIDQAGNADPTPAGAVFDYVDIPLTVTDTIPASPANNNSPKVKGTAPTGSTVHLYTDASCSGAVAASGSAATFSSTGIAVSVPNNSTTTFWAKAQISSDTSPCSSSSVTYVEDSIPPETTINTGPSSITNDSTPTFSYSSSEPSDFQCKVDSGSWVACGSGSSAVYIVPTALSEDLHTFTVKAIDKAGNVDATPATRTFRVEIYGWTDPLYVDDYTGGHDATAQGPNSLDVFYRGGVGDLDLYRRHFDGSQWSAGQLIESNANSDPGAVSWGPGKLDVFVKSGSSYLFRHESQDGGQSFTLDVMAGPTPGICSGPDASSWGAGRIDLVVVGCDAAVWHRYYENGVWSAWGSLGAVATSDPTIASWGSGRLDVFARGLDLKLWHRWYTSGGWSAWEPLGSPAEIAGPGNDLKGGPDAVSWGPGRIDVAVNAYNGFTYHKYFSQTWSQWSDFNFVGGLMARDPSLASWGDQRLDLFVGKGSSVTLYHTNRCVVITASNCHVR